MTTYTVQQHTGLQWEAIQDGYFENAEAAIAAMRELENSLGWRDLRIIKEEDDAYEVVEYGLEADEDEKSAD